MYNKGDLVQDMDERIKEQKANELAVRVLTMSKNALLVHLRFLDMALSMLSYVPMEDLPLATDGKYLVYNPVYVLKKYKDENNWAARSYLHVIMHGIFRHMFINTLVNQEYWDLACDIAVEYSIHGLALPSTNTKRVSLQQSIFYELRKKHVMLTAEKLYRYFLDTNLHGVKLKEYQTAFETDSHVLWYMTEEEKAEKYGVAVSSVNKSEDTSQEDSTSGGESYTLSLGDSQAIQEEWKKISENLQMAMEAFGKRQGTEAGGLMQNLKEVTREKYDYTSFLKKFAVMGEAMKINDDEFDYIFYTYGLNLYKKVPLIEPLEYKDVKRIKEFVIAIDTSGSTSGDLVQTFLQKTYNILKSTESFFSKINLHVIQCDAEIQEDAKITSQEEFDKYIKSMKIHGLGGTDFRPVFDYVRRLQESKEFINLKGLIYFTDGFGTFPQQKPGYETAFVFIDDDYNSPAVPPWAIKLVLQKDEK